jgi:hypothetical protein
MVVAWVALVVAMAAVVRSRRRLQRSRQATVLPGVRLGDRDDRGLPERVEPICELGPGTPWP